MADPTWLKQQKIDPTRFKNFWSGPITILEKVHTQYIPIKYKTCTSYSDYLFILLLFRFSSIYSWKSGFVYSKGQQTFTDMYYKRKLKPSRLCLLVPKSRGSQLQASSHHWRFNQISNGFIIDTSVQWHWGRHHCLTYVNYGFDQVQFGKLYLCTFKCSANIHQYSCCWW